MSVALRAQGSQLRAKGRGSIVGLGSRGFGLGAGFRV